MLDFIRSVIAWIREEDQATPDDLTSEIDFGKLAHTLNYRIRNKAVFSEALSHRSYIHQTEVGDMVSNERLEFLGDSILNMIVAEYLFKKYPALPEGELTKMRSRLVNRKALTAYAKIVSLQDFILMGASIPRVIDRGMEKILADAFEALVAALYIDGGFQPAEQFVKRQMNTAVEQQLVTVEDANYKSQLLEFSQGEGLPIPRYITTKEEGPDHDRVFTVEVYLNEEAYGVGTGKNKKDAEQNAAEHALQKLQLI